VKTIATLGSHCALQVLKGAKDEGFETVVITKKSREGLYRRFDFVDNFITVDTFSELTESVHLSQLTRLDSVLIPHGTLISEVGVKRVEEELPIPIFGSRGILKWEADRDLKERLMKESNFHTPKIFESPQDIDRLVIVKRSGAAGGFGYFLAKDLESFNENMNRLRTAGVLKPDEQVQIQEYIVGVPVYFQFFYSKIRDRLELIGIDRRYETNVDGLGRLPAWDQSGIKESFFPSYLVVGNSPLVLRESLLNYVYEIGERFVETCGRLVPPGMIGPFCIEGVYNEAGNFIVFEFSGRIVAGTNLYTSGSPYSSLLFDKPVSMGRRIAMEIREGVESGSMGKLLT
jgi:5-formaminoimidazole-4-carboxamide-1-(beta)-D-ribofuranosyl 5'-monophosphate synthetase